MLAVNPATGKPIRDYPEDPTLEVDRRIARAWEAFGEWRGSPFEERSRRLLQAARVLRDRRPKYALLMTEEMGKPIAASEAEVEKCAWVCEFYAANAERFLAPQRVATDAAESYVAFEPLGPVLAVMPWNFPFWQVFRFAAPALAAGNVALLKHASNVPGCALAIEEVFREAGFPDGCFATLLIPAAAVGRVVQHPRVRAVTLTGSEKAGREIAQDAGRALKKTVLELGGSDPFIVLADADPAAAAAEAARARTINSGQSCIAAKRFLVEAAIAEPFERAFAEAMAALRVGDPLDRDTQVGPLARQDLLADLHSQVERSLDRGARLLTGGRRLERSGFFYAPTVLAGVEPGMAVFEEETFGPVAAVVRCRDAAHAVALANRSPYGLAASVWTADAARGRALAAQIEAGSVFVNEMVKSDPRLPFGGVKASGYGRELAEFGIREFVNVKSVWIK